MAIYSYCISSLDEDFDMSQYLKIISKDFTSYMETCTNLYIVTEGFNLKTFVKSGIEKLKGLVKKMVQFIRRAFNTLIDKILDRDKSIEELTSKYSPDLTISQIFARPDLLLDTSGVRGKKYKLANSRKVRTLDTFIGIIYSIRYIMIDIQKDKYLKFYDTDTINNPYKAIIFDDQNKIDIEKTLEIVNSDKEKIKKDFSLFKTDIENDIENYLYDDTNEILIDDDGLRDITNVIDSCKRVSKEKIDETLKELEKECNKRIEYVLSDCKQFETSTLYDDKSKSVCCSVFNNTIDFYTKYITKYQTIASIIAKFATQTYKDYSDLMLRIYRECMPVLKNLKITIASNKKDKQKLGIKTNLISDDFKHTIEQGKTLQVRIMLADSMLVDRSFRQFEAMRKYAEKYMDDLYQDFDGNKGDLSNNQKDWTEDYMNEKFVELKNNFCKERIDHIKKIITYVYRNEK